MFQIHWEMANSRDDSFFWPGNPIQIEANSRVRTLIDIQIQEGKIGMGIGKRNTSNIP